MKNKVSVCLAILLLLLIPASLFASTNPVKIEVLYMNHGPLMDTLDHIKKTFAQYGNAISVSWYDFDSKEGEQFMAKKGIKQHIPLEIWLNGNSTVPVNGKQVSFTGFPTGAGPLFFQGKWSMQDLQQALNQLTNRK